MPMPSDVPAQWNEHEEQPRILVVDDEKVIRDILTEFLTLEGLTSAPWRTAWPPCASCTGAATTW